MTRILKSCAAYTDFFVKRSTRYISEAAAAIPTTKLKRSSKPKLHAMSITSIQYFCSPPIIVTSTSQDKKKKLLTISSQGKKTVMFMLAALSQRKLSWTAPVRKKASPQQKLVSFDSSVTGKALLPSWTAPSEWKLRHSKNCLTRLSLQKLCWHLGQHHQSESLENQSWQPHQS